MADDGRVTIRAVMDSPGWVKVSVIDCGEGIPSENLERIFEPLFTTKARGIGLGLAISKNLVEANGGRIEVESEPGKGSVFCVWLPTSASDERQGG
jgi:signal transduction histidine kinase